MMIYKLKQQQFMQTQERLIEQVQTFLRERYQIVVSIPPLKNLIKSTLNLKQIGKSTTLQNRYKLLIKKIDQMMNNQQFQQHEVDLFRRQFFAVIESDIKVMQENQTIRFNSYKIRDKIQYKMKQVKAKQQELEAMSESLHDKEDILSFIGIDLKNYLSVMRLVSDDYNTVLKVKVLTPVNIDNIYKEQISSQETYMQHYEPLLQLLIRLKANMNNLYQEVHNSNKIDMPLKSVNFLANCKNLLIEMQPFLINNECAFNRLIFHVVSCQEENMKLISSFYQTNLKFTRNIVLDVYKCTYLGHLFVDYHRQNQRRLENSKNKIIGILEESSKDTKRAKKQLEKESQNVGKIREQVRRQKKIICYEKTVFMKRYVEEKICKKLNLLLIQKEQLVQLQIILQKSQKYLNDFQLLKQLYERYPRVQVQVLKDVQLIDKDPSLSERLSNNNSNFSNHENAIYRQKQDLFKKNYKVLQTKILQLRQLQDNFKAYSKQIKEKKLCTNLFPNKIEQSALLLGEYFQLQTKLINKYEHLLKDKENKENNTQKLFQQTINDFDNYLEREITPNYGYQIINEDQRQSKVSQKLLKLDKIEYMANNYIRIQQVKEEYCKELANRRKNLQYLFTVFEGSLSDENFQIIINVMDFEPQGKEVTAKNVVKINQMLGVMTKYLRDLKKIEKQLKLRKKNENDVKGQKTLSKIHKIVRDRMIMYGLLQDMYSDCLTVNLQLRKYMQDYNIQTKGIMLFNKSIYEYCLIVYKCKQKLLLYNKLINDIEGMPLQTKNYILDQLYEPYMNRLNLHIKYSQQQLLMMVINLQQSIKIQKQYNAILTNMENAITSPYQQEQQYVDRIKLRSEQVIQLYEKCMRIQQMDGQQYVIHNMNQLKDIIKQCKEFYLLAVPISKCTSVHNINLKLHKQLTDYRAIKCKQQLQKKQNNNPNDDE